MEKHVQPEIPQYDEVAVAGLPTTLIVAGLEEQLARQTAGYSDTDYLTPLLDAVGVLRTRHAGDNDVLDELRSSANMILNRVVSTLEREWSLDLLQLGLDPESADYAADVLELYRFFVVDRAKLAEDLLYELILLDRRRIADRYRKAVEKRNQTVAEARRTFQNFDDVVVWIALPQLLEDMQAGLGWSVPLTDALNLLQADGAVFLSRAASLWGGDDFAAQFCDFFLRQPQLSSIHLRARWMADAPKKTDSAQDQDPQ